MGNGHQQLLEEQQRDWKLATENYRALDQVMTKDFWLDGALVRLQCNPKRLVSSAANVSAAAVEARPCFLCAENRPAQQKGLNLDDYTLLVNPFPVFPKHYTLVGRHEPQCMEGRFGSMLRLARALDDCVVFYNGPRCGASAPDHLHFQAGNKGSLPLESQVASLKASFEPVVSVEGVTVSCLRGLNRGGWLLEGRNEDSLTLVFDRLYNLLKTSTEEPMMNVLAWFQDTEWQVVVFPRKAHRPSCYREEGDGKRLISPASVEMGGLIVAARLEDFERLTEAEIRRILEEVSWSEASVSALSESIRNLWTEPLLEVGIVSGTILPFELEHPYRVVQTGAVVQGVCQARYEEGRIVFGNERFEQLDLVAVEPEEACFVLPEVTIGIGFHWERKERQAFEGQLRILVEGNRLTAVNRVPLEAYLTSVISSEMSAKASSELLKAHAVISRSWLLSQIVQKGKNTGKVSGMIETETERIKWYDREDHTLYDVCADDHCQRYQGVTKASTPQVREAIRATRGSILVSSGDICDARFSKCCGGAMEMFENCWEDSPKLYLQGLADCDAASVEPTAGCSDDHAVEMPVNTGNQQIEFPDLTQEANARQWILGKPAAFCNTTDKRILEQVLNNYDQETTDFYRWKATYTTAEISRLALERSGIDFGEIQDLIPMERGVSGRLIRLKVVGSKRTMVLGKELEIRRTFSTSHLYSSAFVVEKTAEGFVLRGAGWGHGVGLCQIGAAVMGEKGYDYRAILNHYYPNSELIPYYL
jgi:SpoIID/LytB domain protein